MTNITLTVQHNGAKGLEKKALSVDKAKIKAMNEVVSMARRTFVDERITGFYDRNSDKNITDVKQLENNMYLETHYNLKGTGTFHAK